MKKAKHMLLILIFLANTNFTNARGGVDLLTPLFIIFGGYGASILSSIPLAATPNLFKDKDTEYSYSTTLGYSMLFATVFPIMTTQATGDIRVFFSSLVIAPILGTVVGFNASKKNAFTTYKKGKRGWYGGLGIGVSKTSSEYGLTYPAEIGYGVTDNLLIHYSLEWAYLEEYEHLGLLGGFGASYYIKNYGYIKAMSSDSIIVLTKGISKSKKTSIGYGKLISETTAIEFTYENFSLNDRFNSSRFSPTDIFSISINSRFF